MNGYTYLAIIGAAWAGICGLAWWALRHPPVVVDLLDRNLGPQCDTVGCRKPVAFTAANPFDWAASQLCADCATAQMAADMDDAP